MRDSIEANRFTIAIHLIGFARAIGHAARQPHFIIAGFGLNRGDDPVHRINTVKIIRGNDQGPIRMLQRRGKAAAHHIPQNVKNHHIRIIQKMVLL